MAGRDVLKNGYERDQRQTNLQGNYQSAANELHRDWS